VGIDGRSGVAAMTFAAAEAERAGTTLVAVRVYDVPSLVSRAWRDAAEPLRAAESSQRDMLDAMVSAVRRDHEHLEITAVVERGQPSVVLAAHASEARLSVVGRHRPEWSTAQLLGPIAHDLLMNLPGPVAVVPGRAHQGTTRGDGVLHAEGHGSRRGEVSGR
jgi:hypothetical protein